MIQFDFSKCGVADSELKALEPACTAARQKLMGDRQQGRIGWLDWSFDSGNIDSIQKMAGQFQGKFENILVLGIGGSSQGLKCLSAALAPYQNKPKLFVAENPDPMVANPLLESLDFSKTLLVVISKSGATIETWTLFDCFRKRVQPDQMVVITEKKESPLYQVVTKEKAAFLEVPKNIGGRFSVFSPVGLFPLALLGVDIDSLLNGARNSLENPNIFYHNGTIHFLSNRDHGKNISVLMSYGECFKEFGPWYAQLWAESLGKNGKGQTPIAATGPKDQHSLAQLFLDGPKDKLITFVKLKEDPKNPLSHLMERECLATTQALWDANCPSVTLTLEKPDAENFGALLMGCQIQTAFTGHLMGLNPYDQPAVEKIKQLI